MDGLHVSNAEDQSYGCPKVGLQRRHLSSNILIFVAFPQPVTILLFFALFFVAPLKSLTFWRYTNQIIIIIIVGLYVNFQFCVLETYG